MNMFENAIKFSITFLAEIFNFDLNVVKNWFKFGQIQQMKKKKLEKRGKTEENRNGKKKSNYKNTNFSDKNIHPACLSCMRTR